MSSRFQVAGVDVLAELRRLWALPELFGFLLRPAALPRLRLAGRSRFRAGYADLDAWELRLYPQRANSTRTDPRKFWDAATTCEVLLHEVCHFSLCLRIRAGEFGKRRVASHGPEFQALLCAGAKAAYGVEVQPEKPFEEQQRGMGGPRDFGCIRVDDAVIMRMREAGKP